VVSDTLLASRSFGEWIAVFQTIGRTWNLAKLSWRVLLKDKELVLLPIMSFVIVAAVVAVFCAIAFATGSFDRLNDAMSNDTTTTAARQSVNVFDVALYVVAFVVVTYIVIFFNAALVAAAFQRLSGGDPNVKTGLRAVVPHMHSILGWAIISASVGLILQAARSRTNNIVARIALSLVGGVWAYMTFFVVPVLVVRGVGPIEAIKESGSLFRRTWGEQAASNFGFGLFYILVAVIAVLPAALIFAISPVAALIVGIPMVALGIGAVQATEGIFKAALYRYAADGVVPEGFETADLGSSYRPVYR
jgi:hypothetical protein